MGVVEDEQGLAGAAQLVQEEEEDMEKTRGLLTGVTVENQAEGSEAPESLHLEPLKSVRKAKGNSAKEMLDDEETNILP